MHEDTTEIEAKSTTNTGLKGTGKTRLLSLDDLDKRTRGAQAAIALRDRLIAERGGEYQLSAISLQLLTDFAVLSVMVSHAQTRWLSGEDTTLSELRALIDCRRRILETPGVGIPTKPETDSNNPNNTRELARVLVEIFGDSLKIEAAGEESKPHSNSETLGTFPPGR